MSAIGSWTYNVGLAVYVYDRTHSAAWVGAVTVGRFLPSVLFGTYGGVLAERFERTRLMVTLDLTCTVLMAALATVSAMHGAALLAIAIGGLNALLIMAYGPAVAAIIPQLAGEDDLAAANTLYSTVTNMAVVAGPALGAVLFLIGNPAFNFAVNSATFLWSAIIVSLIRTRSTPVDVTEDGRAGPLRQVLVGARTIVASQAATVLVSYSVVASFVYGIDTVLFVIVSEKRLGTGANGYSYLLAGLGVGGVLAAAFIVKRVAALPRLTVPIITGIAVYCLPALALLVVRQPVIAFFVEVVRGAGTLVVDVLAMTALQRSLPKDKLARAFGAYLTFALLAILLGAMVTPPLLSAGGLTTALLVQGALLPLLCLAGAPSLRRMDTANTDQLARIQPQVKLLQQASIFLESSRATLESLARQSVLMYFGPGDDVVVEGEKADALYVIERGDVSVHVNAPEGEREVAVLHAGDYFGEIGLLRRVPRTATVTAASPCRALRIGGEQFLDAFSSGTAAPSLLEGIGARLARNAAATAQAPWMPLSAGVAEQTPAGE